MLNQNNRRTLAKATPSCRAFFLSIHRAHRRALMALVFRRRPLKSVRSFLPATSAVAALCHRRRGGVTLCPRAARRTPLAGSPQACESTGHFEVLDLSRRDNSVGFAACNTGKQSPLPDLASLIAIFESGFSLRSLLSGIQLACAPRDDFAGPAGRAMVEMEKSKLKLPSFSLRIEAAGKRRPGRRHARNASICTLSPTARPQYSKSSRKFSSRGTYRQKPSAL